MLQVGLAWAGVEGGYPSFHSWLGAIPEYSTYVFQDTKNREALLINSESPASFPFPPTSSHSGSFLVSTGQSCSLTAFAHSSFFFKSMMLLHVWLLAHLSALKHHCRQGLTLAFQVASLGDSLSYRLFVSFSPPSQLSCCFLNSSSLYCWFFLLVSEI